jgi:hypothetical protein
MAARRDYRAEYARRIERGLARGLSRSQARGHARPGEAPVSPRGTMPAYDPRLEAGLKLIRQGTTLTRAAPVIGVSAERLRRYVTQTGVVAKQRGRWTVGDDRRPRQMPIFSRGRAVTVTVPGYEQAHYAGRYLAAVRAFLASNDPAYLDPFVGEAVTDVRGKRHVFETRPNVLYRLAAGRGESFEQIYRIVA